MPHSKQAGSLTGGGQWRYIVLLLIVAGSLASMLLVPPLRQDPAYHFFADRRTMLGVPNFLDVTSNVFFLLVGTAGTFFCFASRDLRLRGAWLTLFAGVTMVSAGSAWYHLNPNDATLVWDRLPMTIGFMGLFSALLGEVAGARIGRVVLAPAVLLGIASVLYWHWFADLRLYAWIQFVPLLTIPVLIVLFPPRFTHQWILVVALAFYILAKLAEFYDHGVFEITQGLMSGHTLKHVLAAAGCYAILVMLRVRHAIAGPSHE